MSRIDRARRTNRCWRAKFPKKWTPRCRLCRMPPPGTHVLQLPAHHDRPFRIGRVMKAGPKEAAHDQTKEKREGKQVSIGELLLRDYEGSQHSEDQPHNTGDEQATRKAAEPGPLKILRLYHFSVCVIAHFLAGCCKAFCFSSERSASCARWLRWSART